MAKTLTIREANRLAAGRATVTVDPEDGRLWRVQRPGSVQAHEPMTRLAWQTFLAEKADAGEAVISTKQAEQLLPTVRAAVAALHEVWAKCREVERALGRDLDGLEGVIQDMAAGLDDPESIDVDYVRDAINAQTDELVAEADACPKCHERNVDNLVWQDDGKVKCSTCGMRYRPPAKSETSMLTLKQRQERAARRAARIAAKHDAIRQAAAPQEPQHQRRSTVMKKNEVKVSGEYIAKVSGKLAQVRITGESRYGGWDATNLATKKSVRIKSAQRLLGAAKAKAPTKAADAAHVGTGAKADAKAVTEAKGEKVVTVAKRGGEKAKRKGVLDAAVQVLREAGKPMHCGEIVEQAVAKGLWQTKGKTPAATLYAAVIRHIAAKGDASPFRKTDRGLFELGAGARQ